MNSTTKLILEPIQNFFNANPSLQPILSPLLRFQNKSIFNADLDRYLHIKLTKKGISKHSHKYEEVYYDTIAHLAGYYGQMENDKPFASYWIEAVKKSLKEESPLPVCIKFLSSTISNAISRSLNNNADITSTYKEDSEGNFLYSVCSYNIANEEGEELIDNLEGKTFDNSTRTLTFLKDALALLDPDSVHAEMLKLFLSGLSRREFLYHIRAFGVNGQGGTQSKVQNLKVRIDHYFTDKNGKTQPITKKMAEEMTTPVNIVVEPHYASFSYQLVNHYLKGLREYLQELWNAFEAQVTEEMIDLENQTKNQFLSWEPTGCNRHEKDNTPIFESELTKALREENHAYFFKAEQVTVEETIDEIFPEETIERVIPENSPKIKKSKKARKKAKRERKKFLKAQRQLERMKDKTVDKILRGTFQEKVA